MNESVLLMWLTVLLTKQCQQWLQGKVHGATVGLFARLQHHLLLTDLTQVKPWRKKKIEPSAWRKASRSVLVCWSGSYPKQPRTHGSQEVSRAARWWTLGWARERNPAPSLQTEAVPKPDGAAEKQERSQWRAIFKRFVLFLFTIKS